MARSGKNHTDQEKTELRLQPILRGAFGGAPTPLKDIPKRNGESRAELPINGADAAANARTAQPETESLS
jgi:hypothetical protein